MRANGYEENLQLRKEIVEFERHLHKLDGVSQVMVVGVARPARSGTIPGPPGTTSLAEGVGR